MVKLKPGSRISQIFPNHLHIFLANLRAFRKNMGMYLCKVRHLIFRLFLELHIQIWYHYSKFFIIGKEFLEKSIIQILQYACIALFLGFLPIISTYIISGFTVELSYHCHLLDSVSNVRPNQAL